MTIKELVEEYERRLALKADAEEALSKAKDDLRFAEMHLCAKLEEEGSDAAKINGYSYARKDKTYYSIAGDRDALMDTLREHGAGDLIREVVPPQTFQAYMTEQAEDNFGAVPDWMTGHYSSYTEPRISRRKA